MSARLGAVPIPWFGLVVLVPPKLKIPPEGLLVLAFELPKENGALSLGLFSWLTNENGEDVLDNVCNGEVVLDLLVLEALNENGASTFGAS